MLTIDQKKGSSTMPAKIAPSRARSASLGPSVTRRAVVTSGLTVALIRRQAAFAQSPEATPGAAWSFTDDRDITVNLPMRPKRIVAQISAAAVLWDYGVRPIAIFGPQYLGDGAADPRTGNVDLGAVESVGQLWGELDIERVLALEADLLVTPMWEPPELWYVSPEAQAALEDKIPSLAIQTAKVSLFDAITRFAELAEALGADMHSPQNAAAKTEFDAAVADLEAAIAGNPGLQVIFVAGDDESFYVAHPDFMTDLFFLRDLGMDIVRNDVDDFWETLSWEEVRKYPADLFLIDTREGSYTLDDFANVATWTSVPAVAAGQVETWHAEPIYSYAGYAPELRRLARIVREARADVA
jgi:iron complex transport system substrate-binding protein